MRVVLHNGQLTGRIILERNHEKAEPHIQVDAGLRMWFEYKGDISTGSFICQSGLGMVERAEPLNPRLAANS